ncbi:MAG: hypothetical protein OQL28_08910 [Sedimenticola sp.]|nr:hypothetical protein [Sedimenticola sp.]
MIPFLKTQLAPAFPLLREMLGGEYEPGLAEKALEALLAGKGGGCDLALLGTRYRRHRQAQRVVSAWLGDRDNAFSLDRDLILALFDPARTAQFGNILSLPWEQTIAVLGTLLDHLFAAHNKETAMVKHQVARSAKG